MTMRLLLLSLVSLAACAPAPSVDVGCAIYGEARRELPEDDYLVSPESIQIYIRVTDAKMAEGCK